MKKYTLELTVFISGAVVMILEITGSRILAPYLGTSLFVWTSLIGVILGSLSLGYWLGGRLADHETNFKKYSLIIFISGILIGLLAISKNLVLEFVEKNIQDVRLGSVIASTILFTPSSLFMGMVSPYAVKLKLQNLQNSGSTVGKLYAISTVGSILGTFLAGFYLLSYFGNTMLLIILAISMILTSLLIYLKDFKLKLLAILIFVFQLFSLNLNKQAMAKSGLIELDTDYNHVKIYEEKQNSTGQTVLVLDMGKADHSAMYLNSDELVFAYTKFYRLAKHFKPEIKDALAIGGGAYSYPKDFLKSFPKANLDVVELDPELTEIAKKYFRLSENEHLNIYHEDGRTFLNHNTKKYDVIFGDAFRSFFSIPYQLTTIEAVQKMSDSLQDDGIVLINIISSIEGEKGKFLQAEYATYKKVFPQVYIFPVTNPSQSEITQNIMLLALKSEKIPSFESDNPELSSYLDNLYKNEIPDNMPILTDDFAPVDQYIMEFLKK